MGSHSKFAFDALRTACVLVRPAIVGMPPVS